MIQSVGRNTVDFQVCNGVGVRLHSAAPEIVKRVQSQLGATPTSLSCEPQILVRFEQLANAENLRFAGGDELGVSDHAFYVLRGNRRQRIRMEMRLDGERCELVCQAGTANVPLLEQLVKAAAASRGLLPLHASAFAYRGSGALVCGFPHGGKTTSMLGFVLNGAEFISDDTVFVDEHDLIHGDTSHVSVSAWHLRQLPKLRSAVAPRKRIAIETASLVARSMAHFLPEYQAGRGVVCGGLRKLERALGGRSTDIDLKGLTANGSNNERRRLELAFLSVSHESDAIVVESIEREDFVRWAVRATLDDLAPLTRCFETHRLAFPQRSSSLLSQLENRLLAVAEERFAGKSLYAVHHPHPVSPQSMFEALQSVF